MNVNQESPDVNASDHSNTFTKPFPTKSKLNDALFGFSHLLIITPLISHNRVTPME